jgi:hypothetical protein
MPEPLRVIGATLRTAIASVRYGLTTFGEDFAS